MSESQKKEVPLGTSFFVLLCILNLRHVAALRVILQKHADNRLVE